MSSAESNKMLKKIPSQDSNSDWRIEYLEMMGTQLNPFQKRLLEEGPHKLTDAWALQAMRYDWKRKNNK